MYSFSLLLRLPNVLQGPKTVLVGGDAALGEALHPPTELRVDLELPATSTVNGLRRLLFISWPHYACLLLLTHILRHPTVSAAAGQHLVVVARRRRRVPSLRQERRGGGGVRLRRRRRERVRRRRGHAACHAGVVAVGVCLVGGLEMMMMVVVSVVGQEAAVGVDEVRHPEVAHGVLEAFAVGVAVELLGVLLHPRPPVVLDLVVRPPRQVLRDLRPPGRSIN
jgi:hypothetical protein